MPDFPSSATRATTFSTNIRTVAATRQTINHNLGTTNVNVAMHRQSDGLKVDAQDIVIDGNSLSVLNAAADVFNVTVIAAAPPSPPPDISGVPGLYAAFDAGSIALTDGDPVGSWTDSSGNGHDATQATAGKKPIYKPGIINGRPVVRFDGVDDFLSFASTFNNGSNDAVSMYVVAKRTGGGAPLGLRGDGGATTGWLLRYTSATQWIFAHSSFGTLTRTMSSSANFNLLEVIKTSNTACVIGNNGVLNASASLSNYGIDPKNAIDIGREYNAGEFLAGDIAEIRLYTGAHNTTNRQTVEASLMAKYGIPNGA